MPKELEPPQTLSSLDRLPDDFWPEGFEELYEILSYRNAATLLKTVYRDEFDELVSVLQSFRIAMDDILKGGGNKSEIAINLEAALHPLGWHESRISADLDIRLSQKVPNPQWKKGKKGTRKYDDAIKRFEIERFIDGHQVDFVKGAVAFDLEWNSKDQTFDRDLYALRAFYEAGIIGAGIILTRSSNLAQTFAAIGSRLDGKKKFKDKYGASTTWMGKLTYRINAGRGGGCPILAIGIRASAIDGLNGWLDRHAVVGKAIDAESLTANDEE